MIPEAAVEAARIAVRAAMIEFGPDGHTDGDEEITRAALEAAAPHMLAGATQLIADLTDRDGCYFDHHGGCQSHGYLSLEPGETCPQADAKAWISEHRPTP